MSKVHQERVADSMRRIDLLATEAVSHDVFVVVDFRHLVATREEARQSFLLLHVLVVIHLSHTSLIVEQLLDVPLGHRLLL